VIQLILGRLNCLAIRVTHAAILTPLDWLDLAILGARWRVRRWNEASEDREGPGCRCREEARKP
jgi:hypothetical protein